MTKQMKTRIGLKILMAIAIIAAAVNISNTFSGGWIGCSVYWISAIIIDGCIEDKQTTEP